MGYRTTLADELGMVHVVDMPHIPADVPGTRSVRPKALCQPGRADCIPASLARQTTADRFRTREVDCPICLGVLVS